MRSVVFAHGFTGAPSSWDGVRAAMTGDWQTRSPTLLGHGPGGAHDDARSIEAEADRIACAARELSGPRVLCAYSLGARIGLTALAQHPAVFDAAVLIGVHPGLDSAAERRERVASDEEWAALLERDGLDAFVERWAAHPVLGEESLPAALRAAERERRRSHSAAGLALSLRAHGLGRMTPVDTARIAARVTLVAGGRDTKFVDLARALAPRLGARVEIVEGAGHNVALARPEAVARILEDACR